MEKTGTNTVLNTGGGEPTPNPQGGEPNVSTQNGEPTPNVVNTSTGNSPAEPLTPETVKALIAEAISTARADWEKNTKTQIDNARSQGERLAKMTKEEREAEEKRQEKDNFEAEKRKFEQERLVFETAKILGEKNLPPVFAEFLAQKDAETTNKFIEAFEKAWKEEHQKSVTAALRGNPPKDTGGSGTGGTGDGGPDVSLAEKLGKRQNERSSTTRRVLDLYLNR